MHRIRVAYQMLFFGDGSFAERFARVAAAYSADPVIDKIVTFIRDGGKRPLMLPAASGAGASEPEL